MEKEDGVICGVVWPLIQECGKATALNSNSHNFPGRDLSGWKILGVVVQEATYSSPALLSIMFHYPESNMLSFIFLFSNYTCVQGPSLIIKAVRQHEFHSIAQQGLH